MERSDCWILVRAMDELSLVGNLWRKVDQHTYAVFEIFPQRLQSMGSWPMVLN